MCGESAGNSMCTITRSKMFFKIGVLKKFANFTEKRLCWSFFLILQDRCFPVKFAKFAEEHLFLQNISGGYFYMWPPSKIAAPRQNMEIKKWFLTIERTYNISYHSKEHINIFFCRKIQQSFLFQVSLFSIELLQF